MSLTPKEEDIKKLIVANCHFGGKKVTKQMKRYVHTIRRDGIAIFDVNKIYEKIQVAARMIVSVDKDAVVSVSGKQAGHRAVYKFGHYTKTQSVSGRWSPGMLTNQITKKFVEPRLLIVTDPRTDYNALLESSYINIPVIAICNSDNMLKYVDCAIPCNNRSNKAVAMVWYLLTKAVMELNKQQSEFENATPNEFVNTELEKKKDKKDVKEKEEEDEEEGGQEDNEEEDDDKKKEEEEEDEGDEDFVDK